MLRVFPIFAIFRDFSAETTTKTAIASSINYDNDLRLRKWKKFHSRVHALAVCHALLFRVRLCICRIDYKPNKDSMKCFQTRKTCERVTLLRCAAAYEVVSIQTIHSLLDCWCEKGYFARLPCLNQNKIVKENHKKTDLLSSR